MKEIRSIVAFYDDLPEEVDVVLATLVHVEASSYRRIGARMLIASNGDWRGGISGGCLEGDALRKAQKTLFAGTPDLVVYDTLDEDDYAIGVGLGCNGRIEVLFTPIDRKDPSNPIEILRECIISKTERLLIHIVDPGNPTMHQGQILTISDIEEMYNYFPTEDKSLLEMTARKVMIKKQSLPCTLSEGAKILIEVLHPEIRLHIIGHHYDVYPLVEISAALGWHINCYGRVEKFRAMPKAEDLHLHHFEDLHHVEFGTRNAVVMMTHDFQRDINCLPLIIEKSPDYLGILGPKTRRDKLFHTIGISPSTLGFPVHAPVGLDIGAKTPEEIALSICSEIVAVYENRKGGFLSIRSTPIHERN